MESGCRTIQDVDHRGIFTNLISLEKTTNTINEATLN